MRIDIKQINQTELTDFINSVVTIGKSGYSGYCGLSGYSGYSGKSGYSGFSGYSGYSAKSGFSGYSGFSGKSGYSGFSGKSGYVGTPGGLTQLYVFDSTTSDSNPGSGKLRFNDPAISSVTELFISNNNSFNVDIQPWLDYQFFSDNIFSNYITIFNTRDHSIFVEFFSNTTVIDATGYKKVIAEFVTANGTFFNGDSIAVSVTIQAKGDSGYSGYSGNSGYSGYSGDSGYSGKSGYSGYSGYSGLSGYSGYSSTSGYSGFSGKSGYSGYSGSGISGYSGYSGSGLSGYSGFCGLSGYSGFCGLSGYSGFCGLSGYSGFSGQSGYSGYSGSGVSGYSGYSSNSGYSGYSGANPGASGYSGYSAASPGESGYSGYCGLSGYSGYSGSGLSGYSGYSGGSGYSGYSGASVLTQNLTQVSSSDFTVTALTLQDITGLSFACASGKTYEVDCTLFGKSSTTGGVEITVTYTGSLTNANTSFMLWAVTTSGGANAAIATTMGTAEGTAFWTTANQDGIAKIRVVFKTSTSGNVKIQMQKVTSGTGTVYIGSYMIVNTLA